MAEKKFTVEALKSLPHPNHCYYVDIETNAIFLNEITTIHSICFTFPDGQQLRYSTLSKDRDVSAGIKMMESLAELGQTPIFHNGAGYDIGVIHKFFPETKEWLTPDTTIDTFLLGCILEPDRNGGHSLEDWGEEFGIPKVQNEDWSVCTEHMVGRCLVDTEITKRVYEYLYNEAQTFDSEVICQSLTLESKVSHIHQKQVNHGVHYNLVKALDNKQKADEIIEHLESEILKGAPWKTLIHGVALKNQQHERIMAGDFNMPTHTIVKPFKNNGDYKKTVIDFWGPDQVEKVQGEYVRIECVPLNLNNSGEVKDFLRGLGWKPTEWNYKFENGRKKRTSPKLTEDSYKSLPPGLGKMIGERNTYLHRSRSIYNDERGELKGAITQIRTGHRVPAEAMTCGTPTARYRHSKAVCNIPRPSSLFGKEIRETFGVDPKHLMIGADLEGIESRMLAHYLKGYPGSEEVIKTILADKSKGELDFHTRNANMWKVSRDDAKSGLYALMYGCYPKKLATTLGYPESEGERLYEEFWQVNEPIRLLVEDLEVEYDRNGGWIKGLDGRPLFIRERRKILNTLLQNAAAMVFKKWMELVDESSMHIMWNVKQIIAYHDELQFEFYGTDMNNAITVAKIICSFSLEAGKFYNVKVDTPADYKIGKSWADTH